MKKQQEALTKRTYFNAASLLVNYVATMAVGFFSSPLLLNFLGRDDFGVWKICQRLLIFVSVSDGRATQALKWTIANKQASDDNLEKRRDIGAAVIVWLLFLPLLLLCGVAVAWFSPALIKDLPEIKYIAVRLACAVLLMNLLLLPLRSIPEAVMVGMNMAYRCTWALSLTIILGALFSVVGAYLGYGIVGVALGFLAGSLIGGVVILIQSKRSLPWLGISRPRNGEVRSFMNFSIWILLWSFVNKFMLSGDVVILGMITQTSNVSSYVLTGYAIQMAITLVAILVSAGVPGLGGIVGRGDFSKADKVHSEIMTFSWLLSGCVGATILLLNRSFIGLWVGAENYCGTITNLLMVLMMTQLVFIRTDAFIVDVTLNIKMKVLLGFISTIISLGLAYLLGRYFTYPMMGLLSGIIIGRVILSISYPLLVRKAFGHQSSAGLLKKIRPFFVMACLFSITVFFGNKYQTSAWIIFLVALIFSVFFLSGTLFIFGLDKKQKKFQTKACPVPAS